MAFDFGKKRIGVAVGQLKTKTANPLTVLSAKDGIPNWPEVDALIAEWQVATLIVGLPLNMDGSEQHLTHCARKFGHRLQDRYQRPMVFVDERLTTIAAKERLVQNWGGKGLSSKPRDDISAQVILEDWLSNHNDEL